MLRLLIGGSKRCLLSNSEVSGHPLLHPLWSLSISLVYLMLYERITILMNVLAVGRLAMYVSCAVDWTAAFNSLSYSLGSTRDMIHGNELLLYIIVFLLNTGGRNSFACNSLLYLNFIMYLVKISLTTVHFTNLS